MYRIVATDVFAAWLRGLKDRQTRLRLARRLARAERGHLGDVAPVGHGVFEMREFFGPGWRIYFVLRGTTIVVMLGGGDKSSQHDDIERAKRLADGVANHEDQDPPV